MLDNIKSTFFQKILFSYLKNTKQLGIVKYNKNFQNLLGLNIKHYQILSRKYIIYESKKFGKEYGAYSDFLIYEGEYINGRRNGKGKEYRLGQLAYEGDFKYGKRNGIGKEYDNGKLIYEGGFKNNKRDGNGKIFKNDKLHFEGLFFENDIFKGKTYDENGEVAYELTENGIRREFNHYGLKFEGEFLNWKKNGKGKEFESGKLIFEGQYKNGKKNGIGTEYVIGDLIYKGEYLNDQRHGKGKILDLNGNIIFEGEYLYGKQWNAKYYDEKGNIVDGLKNGKGKCKTVIIHRNLEVTLYEGEFLNGEPNGKGKEFKNSVLPSFKGNYLNGLRHGKGKEYDFMGYIKFEGEYLYDERIEGSEYFRGALIFEGDYLYGRKYNGIGYDKNDGNEIYELTNGNGIATLYYENSYEFKGKLINGKRNGKGKLYLKKNLKRLIYEGDFVNDKITGKGKSFDLKGKLIYEGEYLKWEKKWTRERIC